MVIVTVVFVHCLSSQLTCFVSTSFTSYYLYMFSHCFYLFILTNFCYFSQPTSVPGIMKKPTMLPRFGYITYRSLCLSLLIYQLLHRHVRVVLYFMSGILSLLIYQLLYRNVRVVTVFYVGMYEGYPGFRMYEGYQGLSIQSC